MNECGVPYDREHADKVVEVALSAHRPEATPHGHAYGFSARPGKCIECDAAIALERAEQGRY
jgi:hypothetical protein